MIEEALKQTEAGLVADGHGWFVMNAREARWISRPARGHNAPLTGWTEFEAENADPYARFEPSAPTRYREGWLPGDRGGD